MNECERKNHKCSNPYCFCTCHEKEALKDEARKVSA